MYGLRCLMVCAALAMAGAASAQPSGQVLAVVQSAEIDATTGRKIIQPEMPIFSGDRIVTGPGGEAQIRFRDDTRLVVGPNSAMVIDAFVFNDDNTAREISINAVKGAFRFITGNSTKDAYTITTPTSTIGVRGTEFDVAVDGQGVTRVVNFEGRTRICRRRAGNDFVDPADCVEVRDPCTLSVIRPRSQVVNYSGDDDEFKSRQLLYYFPYVRDQGTLLDGFRVDAARCISASSSAAGGDWPVVPPPTPTPLPEPPKPPPVMKPSFTPPPLPPKVDRHSKSHY